MPGMRALSQRLRAVRPRDLRIAGATAALAAVTGIALVLFFPGRDHGAPRLSLAWPGRAARVVGPLEPIAAWRDATIDVSASGLTAGGVVGLQVGGIELATPAADGQGRLHARVRLPGDISTGLTSVVLVDRESGREAPLRHVVVLPLLRRTLWAGADAGGRSALLLGTGFPPSSPVRLALDGAPIGQTHARRGGTLALVIGLQHGGRHVITALAADGGSVAATVGTP
jgi:hypothetical protein